MLSKLGHALNRRSARVHRRLGYRFDRMAGDMFNPTDKPYSDRTRPEFSTTNSSVRSITPSSMWYATLRTSMIYHHICGSMLMLRVGHH